MAKNLIYRHKNCGGFILPDLDNSFTGMGFGYCPKCNKDRLTVNDYDTVEEDIILYTIRNKSTNEFLLFVNNDSYVIVFESEEQAHEFAKKYEVDNYKVEQIGTNDSMAITNGKVMIIKKEAN